MEDYIQTNKEIWEKHFENIRLDYPNEEVVRFLAKYKNIYANGNMLDWGCATGRHTMLGCKFGYHVYAVDYVKNCVDITKAKIEKELPQDCRGKVEKYIVNQDIDIEEVLDASMDIILAWGILFYNNRDNQLQMIKNMYRMLKKGGRAFCDFRTERDSAYMNSLLNNETDEKGTVQLKTGTRGKEGLLWHVAPLEELEKMFADAGLVMENVELYEFTENNREIRNSWWHITLYKEN